MVAPPLDTGAVKEMIALPGPVVMPEMVGADGAEMPAVMVKLVLEISKKMLLAQATLMRAVLVGVFGTVMEDEPLFGALAANTVGKVLPPSVDSEIATLGQLTGAKLVLATFHATVWLLPPCQLTDVSGALTKNGPAAFVTLKLIVL
jgi:hypothetical protein